MTGDCHVRFCERLKGKCLGSTRLKRMKGVNYKKKLGTFVFEDLDELIESK